MREPSSEKKMHNQQGLGKLFHDTLAEKVLNSVDYHGWLAKFIFILVI